MADQAGMHESGIFEAVQAWMAQADDAQVLTFREAVERLTVERLDARFDGADNG